jgi:glycosyltransferase involved in cell wall biosynthesis
LIASTARGQRPYRIGFVSDGVYPFNKGGKERRLWEISRRLVAGGIEVHIYTMKWWTGGRVLNLDGVQLHAISKKRSLYHGERRSMAQAVLFGLTTLKLLVARFDVLDVDHMPYFPLFSARIVCALRRKRMVATWHEVWGNEYWRTYLGRLAPISAAIERLAAHTPDAIVAVSAQTSSRLTNDLGVTAPIHTIELGVDLEAIRAQEKSDLRSDILFAGRLLAHKNVDVLLRAVALLTEEFPRLRCRIVGEGPERLRLEALSEELGLADHVVFHDFFPGAEIYGVMKSATVFALPSVREGFGAVVLEANCCGLPVVTVDHPDNTARHLITEGETGFLTDVTPAGLAKALIVAMFHARLLDPNGSQQRTGYLRDWSEVAAAVLRAVSGDQLSTPRGQTADPLQRGKTVGESA